MGRTILFGDIHGCYKSLKSLIDKLAITPDDKLIFLGDYIDKGASSKLVIDLLLELSQSNECEFLRGNHEQMLIDAYYHKEHLPILIRVGGLTTLHSFGIDSIEQLDKKYIDFFINTKFIHEMDEYYIVHAGLNFEIDNPLSDIPSMLWTRNKSIDPRKINNKRLIVGHTPKTIAEIEKSLNENVIFLDGGCVFNEVDTGICNLVALTLETKDITYVQNIE